MKLKIVYTSFSVIALAIAFMSFSGGVDGNRTGGPTSAGTCVGCHAGGSNGSIALSGAPAVIIAGQTYNMTLTITSPTAVEGGFMIIANNASNAQVGNFNPGSGQKLNNINLLVQSTPKAFSGGSVSWPISWTAPLSITGSPITFYFSGNAANGNSATTGDAIYSGFFGGIPLPVVLSTFNAQASHQNTVELNWLSHTEEQLDRYEVERAVKANQFEKIGDVIAHGNSNEALEYKFEDKNPPLHQHVYYRLKHVDLDGRYSFSPVQSVYVAGADVVHCFPNPLQGPQDLQIIFSTQQDVQKKLVIKNALGSVVYQSSLARTENEFKIQLPHLPSGMYYASFFGNNELLGVRSLVVRR